MKKIFNLKLIVTIAAFSFLFISCEDGINEDQINAEMDNAQYKLETTAYNIDRGINELEMKLDTASAEVSTEIRAKISKLEDLRLQTNDKLEDLSNTSAENWDKIKSDFDSFIDDLENDLNTTLEKNNNTEMR